jgi:hypothetical protein
LQEFQLRIVDIIVEEETREKKQKFEKNYQLSENDNPMVVVED